MKIASIVFARNTCLLLQYCWQGIGEIPREDPVYAIFSPPIIAKHIIIQPRDRGPIATTALRFELYGGSVEEMPTGIGAPEIKLFY
jgi:hypothetical protein